MMRQNPRTRRERRQQIEVEPEGEEAEEDQEDVGALEAGVEGVVEGDSDRREKRARLGKNGLCHLLAALCSCGLDLWLLAEHSCKICGLIGVHGQ
jgi:hypothetical protein